MEPHPGEDEPADRSNCQVMQSLYVRLGIQSLYRKIGMKFMDFGSRLQELFEPQEDWPLKTLVQFQRQRQIHALWIGIIAFLLPILLYFGHRSSSCFRDSISHSYYLPFWGDVFVALTCFVGLFLMFYRGQSLPERVLAISGGVFAVCVAIIPTNGSGCEEMLSPSRIFFLDPTDTTVPSAYPHDTLQGKIHLVSAILLFIVLAVFNLFVFTATDKNNDYQVKRNNRNKLIRNWIYKIAGGLMVASLVILVVGFGFKDCDAFSPSQGITVAGNFCSDHVWFDSAFWDDNNLTFYFEWLALACFGVAWFVKGRGGGFLLLDEKPDQLLSKPWWWPLRRRQKAIQS